MGTHLRIMPPHRREAIETEIEIHLHRATLLIARLDRADEAMMDLEEDDDCGDILDKGEGVGDFGRGLLPTLPIYGIDQSGGPINFGRLRQQIIDPN